MRTSSAVDRVLPYPTCQNHPSCHDSRPIRPFPLIKRFSNLLLISKIHQSHKATSPRDPNVVSWTRTFQGQGRSAPHHGYLRKESLKNHLANTAKDGPYLPNRQTPASRPNVEPFCLQFLSSVHEIQHNLTCRPTRTSTEAVTASILTKAFTEELQKAKSREEATHLLTRPTASNHPLGTWLKCNECISHAAKPTRRDNE